MALQTFFRETDGSSTTPSIPAGHGDSAIDDFLASRRGYCEQFAGTFAAFARAVGLPARVAVGFTQGISDGTDPAALRGQGRARPRLARGLPRPVRVGAVRADARAAATRTPRAYTGVAGPAGRPGAEPDHQHDRHHHARSDHHPEPGAAAGAGRSPGRRRAPPAASSSGVTRLTWPARLSRRRRRAAGAGPAVPGGGAEPAGSAAPTPPPRRARRGGAGAAGVAESEEVLVLADQERRPAETASEFAARAAARVPSQRSGLAEPGRRRRCRHVRRRRRSSEHAADQAEAVAVAVRDTVHRSVVEAATGAASAGRSAAHRSHDRDGYSSRLKRSRIFELVLPK